MRAFAILLAISSVSLFALSTQAEELDPQEVEFFEKKIRPVLVQQCYKCHSQSSTEVKGELLLDTREGIRRGGESGHAVVPGDIDASALIDAIRYESVEMPPNGKLPDNVIADFVRWVEMGAPDPRDGKSGLIKREINFEEGRKFWAFQQPKKTESPAVTNSSWPQNEIDLFILARLESNELKPVETADPLVLVRRIYFDLIGLPPSPEEVEQFQQSAIRDLQSAIKTLVDRLMDSPQFGERWGRHWLDVARYAESNGRERNYLYPNAWRYRDYVIASFNKDKPFDQFVREQIAGDLLPADNDEVRDEQIIASGFLAIGPKSLNERNREKFLMDVVDEQIDVSTRSVMALTVSCARCHDHKFDPIPTEEYYSVAGIFRSTDTLFGAGGKGSRQATKLWPIGKEAPDVAEQRKQHEEQVAEMAKLLKVAQGQAKKIQAEQRKKKAKKAKDEKIARESAVDSEETKATEEPVDDAKSRMARIKQMNPAELRREIKLISNDLKKLRQSAPAARDVAMGLADGKAVDCRVLVRGEVDNPGKSVSRGYLTILSPENPPEVANRESSGRLELAEWLSSSENPLTARVAVNRIWHHLFGHGLVRTVDNFGATGERPTHPELLDWLAVEFMQEGWSFKRMIKTVMLSRTYQLSSQFDEQNFEADPDNLYLWRMNSRRIDAESLRDAMLSASGQIDLTPVESSVVAKYKSGVGIGRGVDASAFNVNNQRRSVYLPIVRNAVPDSLKVFDFAEPSIIVGRRSVTTVPAQALYLLNNSIVIKQSDETARRLLTKDDLNNLGRVEFAYELILCRKPTEIEQDRAVNYINKTLQKLQQKKDDEAKRQEVAWSGLCQALFATAEFRYLD